MTCENPITITNKNTKEKIEVPCRKCILCRQKKCRDWAIKLIKEAQYHTKMCMITLTFGPKFLLRPYWVKLYKYKRIPTKENIFGYKIIKETHKTCINPMYIRNVKKTGWLITRFNKKIRKHFAKEGKFISFFAVGEHGTKNTHRAHWHIIYYGISKEDLEALQIGESNKGKPIFYSKIIENLWSFKKLNIGKHTISDVNEKTIKYTANYTMKKLYDIKNEQIYKTDMRFSSQNKLGIKWIRRYHREIRKGYLTDKDGGKYSVPEGWRKELKRYCNKKERGNLPSNYIDNNTDTIDELKDMCQSAEIYEELIEQEYIKRLYNKELNLKEEAKKKAERLKFRISMEDRDTF